MKRINKIAGLSLSLAAVCGLASCSNEINEPSKTPGNGAPEALKLVKNPDAIVWSGSETYGNTFGTRDGVDTDNTTSTDEKTYYVHNDEVEINLSLLDEKLWDNEEDTPIADLVTKLSIHVRKATDVEVVLPLPSADYIIESDDLLIFHEHYGNFTDDADNVLHGTKLEFLGEDASHTLPYTVGGQNVTLTVSFEDDGIHVKTDGINDAVMTDCFGHNNDGLNFEVYNYYQTATVAEDGTVTKKDGVVRADLKNAFNAGATVTFLDANPTYYINAFGYEKKEDYDYNGGNSDGDEWHGEGVNLNDCKVVPVSGYSLVKGWLYDKNSEKIDGTEENDHFTHLNGTPYNYIYVYGQLEPDHAHGGAPEPKKPAASDDDDDDEVQETPAPGDQDTVEE